MKKSIIVLFVLNALALGLCFYLLSQLNSETNVQEESVIEEKSDSAELVVVDSTFKQLPDNARTAYFFMDSVSSRYLLVADREKTFKSEAARLESQIKKAARRADARYKQLAEADYTYSTQEERQKAMMEMENLLPELERKRGQSENELARLELSMLEEVTNNLTGFLEDYNGVQNLDFIYSIQNGGQIWVGNEGLNITDDVVNGLNSRYLKSKNAPVAPADSTK